jgi:hypothetical protein
MDFASNFLSGICIKNIKKFQTTNYSKTNQGAQFEAMYLFVHKRDIE